MFLDFPKFSFEALDKIISFLDNVSCHRMVRVLLSTPTKIDGFFLLEEGENDEIKFRLFLENDSDYSLWEICFISIIRKLAITTFFLKNDFNTLTVIVKTQRLVQFLKYLKPFVHRVTFDKLICQHENVEIIESTSDLFDGRSVNYVTIRKLRKHLNAWLDLVQKIKTDRITVHPNLLTKNVVTFLLHIAELVNNIRIYMENGNENDNMRHKIVPLIKSMFGRKCKRLSFGEETTPLNRNASISLNDAEKLIQFIHQLDKNVSLYTYSDCQPSIYHIGLYTLEIEDDNENGSTTISRC